MTKSIKSCHKAVKRFSILTAMALSVTACGNDNVPVEPVRPVIEGFINSDGNPMVLFSSSVVPGIDGNLSENVVTWGKIMVSDGEQEVILTGRVDHSCFPPFRYYSLDMKGEPGHTYKITADFRQLHAEAICTMPYPTPIDSIVWANADGDSLKAATLHFTAPQDVPAYYYLTLTENSRGAYPRPCMMGTFKAESPGAQCALSVWKPKSKIDTVKYVAHFKIGEEGTVSLNRITPEVYDFWNSYINMMLFSASPFLSTDSDLPTNISGGLGVWSAQATTSMSFIVE